MEHNEHTLNYFFVTGVSEKRALVDCLVFAVIICMKKVGISGIPFHFLRIVLILA